MFDDPAVEIQDLTSVIKQDITALNAAISELQVLCDSRNEAANRTKHSSEHSTTIVDDLKSRLMSTTKDFKDVLTMRTENLKVHENRRQIFSATASKDQTNPFARQRPLAAASSTSTTPLSGSHAPWANGATSNSQLFSSRYIHAHPLIFQGLELVLVEFD
jgi:syntaxin 5